MMHLSHTWPKWSAPTDKTFYFKEPFTSTVKEIDGQVQERTCIKCGKYQWRKV